MDLVLNDINELIILFIVIMIWWLWVFKNFYDLYMNIEVFVGEIIKCLEFFFKYFREEKERINEVGLV